MDGVQKRIKAVKCRIALKKKDKQLAWIKKHGVYNYPVKEDDELKQESCAKVKELWLYASAKGKRHCFAADFVGIQSKDEFLAANPTYAKLGPNKCSKYMVFKTTILDYGPRLEGATVFARVSDFEKGRDGIGDCPCRIPVGSCVEPYCATPQTVLPGQTQELELKIVSTESK